MNGQLHWRIKTTNNGLISDQVTSLNYDKQNQKLIVGCIGGLSITEDAGMNFNNYTAGLESSSPVAAYFSDNNHSLWVATHNHGLLKADL